MLLTIQQQYMLDVLQRLGCIRRRQLAAMLQARFFSAGTQMPPTMIDAILRQFRCGNIEILTMDDVLLLPGRTADDQLLEAVDIMLELSEARPTDFWAAGTPPILLRFSVTGRRLSLFAVLQAAEPMGPDVRAPPRISKAERVVVLLSDDDNPPSLDIPNHVFYALRQKDGSHRFFARGEDGTKKME